MNIAFPNKGRARVQDGQIKNFLYENVQHEILGAWRKNYEVIFLPFREKGDLKNEKFFKK